MPVNTKSRKDPLTNQIRSLFVTFYIKYCAANGSWWGWQLARSIYIRFSRQTSVKNYTRTVVFAKMTDSYFHCYNHLTKYTHYKKCKQKTKKHTPITKQTKNILLPISKGAISLNPIFQWGKKNYKIVKKKFGGSEETFRFKQWIQ